MIAHRAIEAIDWTTRTFFAGATVHFALLDFDFSAATGLGGNIITVFTIAIGACKLFEIFTGKKIHRMFGKKKDHHEEP